MYVLWAHLKCEPQERQEYEKKLKEDQKMIREEMKKMQEQQRVWKKNIMNSKLYANGVLRKQHKKKNKNKKQFSSTKLDNNLE